MVLNPHLLSQLQVIFEKKLVENLAWEFELIAMHQKMLNTLICMHLMGFSPPTSPAGIIDEEMPMMTFDVGGETGVHETEDHLETSVAVIKDLSSLAALSFVDPKDAMVDLLAKCRIDVSAIDKKVGGYILCYDRAFCGSVSMVGHH